MMLAFYFGAPEGENDRRDLNTFPRKIIREILCVGLSMNWPLENLIRNRYGKKQREKGLCAVKTIFMWPYEIRSIVVKSLFQNIKMKKVSWFMDSINH